MVQHAAHYIRTGDMKEADAPSIKEKLIVNRLTPVCSAAFIAMGKSNAAAALFVTTFELEDAGKA